MAFHLRTGNVASTYLEQEILSESPLARVARLHDMAQTELTRARAALTAREPKLKGLAVSRALRTIAVLHTSLDMESGGEPARNLDRLYHYLQRRISEGHARNDEQALIEVGRHLGELGAAWREVASRSEPVTVAVARGAAR